MLRAGLPSPFAIREGYNVVTLRETDVPFGGAMYIPPFLATKLGPFLPLLRRLALVLECPPRSRLSAYRSVSGSVYVLAQPSLSVLPPAFSALSGLELGSRSLATSMRFA